MAFGVLLARERGVSEARIFAALKVRADDVLTHAKKCGPLKLSRGEAAVVDFVCRTCRDTGWVEGSSEGGRRYVPCECRRGRL